MLENKDYCDYDTCVALKELGFNTKCHGYYESLKRCFNTTSIKRCWCNSEVNDIGIVICPTLYEAQKWLREEKEIAVFATYDKNTSKWFATVINMDSLETTNMVRYDSYEEALSEGVRASIKILQDEQKENN